MELFDMNLIEYTHYDGFELAELVGYVPDHDSYLMTRFKKAGLVALGRATVPELGISGQIETIFF
jgi:Asp-tRNA(Asn)/Glu-tRNA(Gln) amidotransferase A subunit family amidase